MHFFKFICEKIVQDLISGGVKRCVVIDGKCKNYRNYFTLNFLIFNSQIGKPNVYKFVQNKNIIIKKTIKIDKRKKTAIIIYKKSTNEQGAGE